MPVHLFKIRQQIGTGIGAGTARAARWGHQPGTRGRIPPPSQRLWISGITKDSAGIALASCIVQLFRTVDDLLFEEVVSSGSGNYAFSAVGLSESYYVVAYKAGSPDVAGTTRNDLVGA